jgi:hypothetical protein
VKFKASPTIKDAASAGFKKAKRKAARRRLVIARGGELMDDLGGL